MKKLNTGRTLRRVLVVHKDSTFQTEALEKKDPRILKLLAEGSEAICTIPKTHEQHLQTLADVERELSARGIAYDLISRAGRIEVTPDVDLIVTVGGDGTFLRCARECSDVPIVGVNSAKPSSLGHFCVADGDSFGAVLDDILSGARRWYRLARLELVLNGNALPVPVLNEVLIHDVSPAGTCRYILAIGDDKEIQRSSGMYISPPSGSTAVNRSAGGKILPITQRQFQYLVREPGMRPDETWKLLGGILSPRSEVRVISQMTDGRLYVDGKYGFIHEFLRGDELIVRLHPHDVKAYIDPNINKRYQLIK